MSTTTTNYGLIKPDTTDPILIGQLNDNADIIDATLKSLSDVLDVAKLGIKYKGEVNYYSNLPASGNEIGDAYTVKYAGSSGTTPDGTEYVWGTVSGTNQWINFSKDSYTKAEVDALLSLKVDTAGTGLSKSGTTLNHSNSTTAKTTQGFAQIAYDAQGHITGSTAATTAQANAINSGIDSAKVEQIETNKNNISYNTNNGVKNYLPINSGATTGAQYVFDWVAKDIPAGQYIISFSTTATSGAVAIEFGDSNTSTYNRTGYRIITLPAQSAEVTVENNTHYVRLFANAALTITEIMLRPASISDSSYQPYAMSNVELTAAIQAIQAQLANQ